MKYPEGTEVYDTPDPPPKATPEDDFWWFANRAAEQLMKYLRLVGLL